MHIRQQQSEAAAVVAENAVLKAQIAELQRKAKSSEATGERVSE